MLIIRGGLPAIGARLRDKEGRDVSSWPLGGGGGGGGGGGASSSSSSASAAAAAPAAAAVAPARVPCLEVPRPRSNGQQPRPSGASFWRESETYEAFQARLAARWERWAALHNLERLAYKLCVLGGCADFFSFPAAAAAALPRRGVIRVLFYATPGVRYAKQGASKDKGQPSLYLRLRCPNPTLAAGGQRA